VLVAEYDNRAVPKVIDFGVAKATAQRLTERTMFTEFGQVLGTMEYMSPEQSKFNQLDIDTRSDIYSLGVLLYELLAGSTPFEGKRLHEAAFDEMLRIIRDEEPPKPSTRLNSLSLGERAGARDSLASVAANRHTEPARLSKDVRGELDWIVMKALEKDRNRRYETASGMASDVQRYLDDEAVLACPPSARYRLRKFARRYQAAIATAASFAAILVLGLVVSTWLAFRASRAESIAIAERNSAEQARREAVASAEAERKAKDAETAHRIQAEEVSNYLTSAFSSPAPWRDGRTITIVEVLDRDARELQGKLADNPVTKAALLEAIGNSYVGLGLSQDAIPLFQQALQLRKSVLGQEHSATLETMHLLAGASLQAHQYDDVVPLAEETLKRRKAQLGPHHPDTMNSTNDLAIAYWAVNRHKDALPLLEENLEARMALFGPDDNRTLSSADTLGTFYSYNGRMDEALPLMEETVKIGRAKPGSVPLETLWAMEHLADAYRRAGRPADAKLLEEELSQLRQNILGPNHPDTIRSIRALAPKNTASENGSRPQD
jgi:tetratricopeptide (TPR) repeat protein